MLIAVPSIVVPGHVTVGRPGERVWLITPDEAHALATELRNAAFAAYRAAPTHDATDLEGTG